MRRAAIGGFVHLAIGAAGAAGAVAANRSPLETGSLLGLSGASAAAVSLALGGLLAAVTIAATRALVREKRWASALAEDLRPAVLATDGAWPARTVDTAIAAVAPGVGEELFFRGFLIPLLVASGAGHAVGVALPAIAFGALHQVRGRGRWAWALSAGAMATALGVVFVVSGSLLGCIVAHIAINAHNLRLVRDQREAAKPRRRLGGLLSRF